LVVSKKDFSSLLGGSPGLDRDPVPFPNVFLNLATRCLPGQEWLACG